MLRNRNKQIVTPYLGLTTNTSYPANKTPKAFGIVTQKQSLPIQSGNINSLERSPSSVCPGVSYSENTIYSLDRHCLLPNDHIGKLTTMTETPAAAIATETPAAAMSIREGVLNAFEAAAEESFTEPAPTPETATPVATTITAAPTKKHEKTPEIAASKPSPKPVSTSTPTSTPPTPTPKPLPKATPTPTVPPPRECTDEEYTELQEIASQLTLEEATEEILDAARYGELDSVRALLEHHNQGSTLTDSLQLVNGADPRDDTKNTALHKACANGHAPIVALLLHNGANVTLVNAAGNSALHWAAAGGHTDCVKMLVSYKTVDVLLKNAFGRSALTEGFSSQKTALVGLLLEHDSASEEKLLSDVKTKEEVEVNEEDIGGIAKGAKKEKKAKPVGITHEFDFLRRAQGDKASEHGASNVPVLVRELPITNPDNPFGEVPSDDSTGLGIWCASLVMSRWIADSLCRKMGPDTTVLELGAGCGIPGLAASHYSKASKVYITDLNPQTIDNLKHNVKINNENDRISSEKDDQQQKNYTQSNNKSSADRVEVLSMDWNDPSTYPSDNQKIDILLGSDLIYQSSIVPHLKKIVLELLNPTNGVFYYVAPDTGRDGLPQFIEELNQEGFDCVNHDMAPDWYRGNPLMNGDDDECFLHFHEMMGKNSRYILHEFRRGQTKEKSGSS